ncbi:MAG: hypothetical protein ACLQUY_04025 [Ktedonobacterales bacterium]
MDEEKADELVQRLREQRLTTLSLADQIKDDRWRESVLPRDASLHDLLADVLAWDEWAIAVFEISLIRDLPTALQQAMDDADAFNRRAEARYRGISRDDMLSGLQSANPRLIASAKANGGTLWYTRMIDGLMFPPNGSSPYKPSVGEILRLLRWHEFERGKEIMTAFGISAKLDVAS